MRIPISEEELGAWYIFDETCAIFYPINASYYNNCGYKYQPSIISSFKEFKQTYPILIGNGRYIKLIINNLNLNK